MAFKPYSPHILPLLLSLLLLLSLCSAQDDGATLRKIKEQLGDPDDLSDWKPDIDYCAYSYVHCGPDHRVHQISFKSINLTAPVPPALGDLTELELLNIEKIPGLYGPIPDSFGKLSHLQFFYISDTSVSGPLPKSLSSTNLTAMALFNNKINGSIPASLSILPYLSYLELSNNSLTGRIPPGLVHGSESIPSWLILHHNDLTGELPEYYASPYADTVHVGNNRLRGDPSFLFTNCSRFSTINLTSNNFKFDLTNVELPETIRFLDLSHNRIKGEVPRSLIDKRVVLDLSFNRLCGEIPTGGYMSWHKASSYENNKCLCGTPLPDPCTKSNHDGRI